MKIAITAPVYITNEEHLKYLDLTTKSIVSQNHDIVFIPVENFITPLLQPLMYRFDNVPESIHKVSPDGQQSVSKAWNLGIRKAQELGCEYVIVINTDIVFKSNAIDRLVAFAENNSWHVKSGIDHHLAEADQVGGKVVMWTMSEYVDLANLESAPEDENYSEHPHFSCFMVRSNFVDELGEFDENFVPAYCEDGDMHARIALANYKAYIYGGAKFFHFGSRTIKSDRELWDKNTKSFPQCQQYFLDKWGHSPVGDVNQMRELYFKFPYNEEDKDLSYWRKTSA